MKIHPDSGGATGYSLQVIVRVTRCDGMKISRIALCDMTWASSGAEVCAVVLCETEAGQVSLAVRAPATDDPTEALIEDALRQLRRLPGYRCGSNEVALAPDVVIDVQGA